MERKFKKFKDKADKNHHLRFYDDNFLFFYQFSIMEYFYKISISGCWGPTANIQNDAYGGEHCF